MESIQKSRVILALVVVATLSAGLWGQEANARPAATGDEAGLELATFGGGCFWCVEAVFENIDGVVEVVSGYSGGRTANPSYEQVCSGFTGHAEVCQIRFDPAKVSYEKLLEVFWQTHDPTTLNRQGPDVGSQYRSVVFYHSLEQRRLAEKYKKLLDESGAFSGKIVTEIKKAPKFFVAEEKHQDYFRNNPGDRYCAIFAQPKLDKLKKVFPDIIADKKEAP